MTERNFKVGDKVRIRSWEDMESEFGLDEQGNIDCRYLFTREMQYLCGKDFTISSISENHYYSEEKPLKINIFIWP